MDTIMLNSWLHEGSELQDEMNETVAYQKDGSLDWDTNQSKFEEGVTENRAFAPKPIQLTTDVFFNTCQSWVAGELLE